MNTERVSLLLVGLLVFAAGTPSLAAADVAQTTGSGSWCSPAQNGNGNTVICNGVDPRALDRLNELLDRKDLDLKQKTEEANDWARRYNDLNAQLEETKTQLTGKGEDATLVETAQDLLHEGKLEEARAIFERLIQADEANVDRAAQDHFGRASVFALQFRLDEALPDYAKAYQYRPDDQRYSEAYAIALYKQSDYPRAEAVLQELLKQRRSQVTRNPTAYWQRLSNLVYFIGRELAAQVPAAFRQGLAQTLNNLGIHMSLGTQQQALAQSLSTLGALYTDTHHLAEAEAALKEAAGIERELATQNPAAYRPNLTQTLINLGVLYIDTHHFAEAEAALKEAEGILRDLAVQNPAAYRHALAQSLSNLGILYTEIHRFSEAEAALKEAADIRRGLAAQNPAAYRHDLARPLSSLGTLYTDMQRFSEAEAALKEAADILRDLAAQNPAVYRFDLASTLNNLGIVYADMQRFAEAEPVLKEAAGILGDLAAQNPAAYRPDLALTLNNLAFLYRNMHRDSDAEAAEAKALAAAK
jgi:hypothetical protein